MNELRLTAEQLRAIVEHGERAYPEECCGILIGSSIGAQARVERLIAADNQREEENRHNRFLIDPLKLLEAQKSAREEGLAIIGYYHSHPDHRSAPSDFDRDHAWPDTSYLIVSIKEGTAADHRSWRLLDNRTAFEEENVQIVAQVEDPPAVTA